MTKHQKAVPSRTTKTESKAFARTNLNPADHYQRIRVSGRTRPTKDNDPQPPRFPSAPGMRIVTISEPLGLDLGLERLARYNAEQLRKRNEQIQSDISMLDALEIDVRDVVDWAALNRALNTPFVGRDNARELMKQIGFLLGSLNRHYLVRAADRGETGADQLLAAFFLRSIGFGLADFLARLASHAKHPPYQSYVTYWTGNPEGLSFTNDPGEQYFRSVVNETNRRFAMAAEFVRPLQAGDVGFDQKQAKLLLSAAANEVEQLLNLYNFRLNNPETGQQRMTVGFFMRVMRGYIAPVLLDDTKIEGPNATYSPGWPRLDYAIGNRSLFYVNTVQNRYRWMIPEHRLLLDQALDLPSLVDQMVTQIGTSYEELAAFTTDQLRSHLEARSSKTRDAVLAHAKLVSTFNMVSGTHFSMIRNYLTKPAQALPEAELARLVPRPDGGVGGNPIAHTELILAMRRTHPVNSKLIDAVRGLN